MSTTTHRRPRKIRRTGRHTTPSSVEKVAEKAGKAAPAVAIAGVLVAGPAVSAVTAGSAQASTVAVRIYGAPQLNVHEGATTTAYLSTNTAKAETETKAATRTYSVQPGDSLASIAQRFYGSYNDWTALYDANKAKIANPNQIYPGELLLVPASASAASHTASHAAKHAKKSHGSSGTLTTSAVPSGTLSCHSLEELWEDAGGSSHEAVMAASIAMAESGGNQYALSPTDDVGYWQINETHGPELATYNALGNAKAAVEISSNGSNWDPWTTYTSGAYYGRC